MRLFIAPSRFHFPEAPPSGGNFGLNSLQIFLPHLLVSFFQFTSKLLGIPQRGCSSRLPKFPRYFLPQGFIFTEPNTPLHILFIRPGNAFGNACIHHHGIAVTSCKLLSNSCHQGYAHPKGFESSRCSVVGVSIEYYIGNAQICSVNGFQEPRLSAVTGGNAGGWL